MDEEDKFPKRLKRGVLSEPFMEDGIPHVKMEKETEVY